MNHKLLIEYSVEIDPKFKSHIGQKDIVRAVSCSLKFSVTNSGDRVFPGGDILPIDLDFNNIVKQTWIPEKPESCPELAIGEKKDLLSVETVPITDGLAWIKITIHSKDNQPIDYLRVDNEPGQPIWRDCVYVVNREILLTLIKISGG